MASELRKTGISPSKIPRVIKDKLLFNHVVTGEIKAARQSTGQKGKTIIANVLSGQIVRKYNMKSMVAKYTGVRRKVLGKSKRKMVNKAPVIRKNNRKNEIC